MDPEGYNPGRLRRRRSWRLFSAVAATDAERRPQMAAARRWTLGPGRDMISDTEILEAVLDHGRLRHDRRQGAAMQTWGRRPRGGGGCCCGGGRSGGGGLARR